MLKLNLGCGNKRMPGFVNVDKFGSPDLRHDLEVFPWPWPDNSVGEVVMNHVLEHLGESTATFLGIMKELYRVCAGGARVVIAVPHPRSDDFLNDPTHVRPITPGVIHLFSKRLNEEWAKANKANSPLATYLDVDFEVRHVHCMLTPVWHERLTKGEITEEQIPAAAEQFNNVIRQFTIEVEVVKP